MFATPQRGPACISFLSFLFSTTLADSGSPCCSRDAGFDPVEAADLAKSLSSHSWEYGTAAEALLELYNPELSVFSRNAFPNASLPVVPLIADVPALEYVKPHIRLGSTTLIDGDGASGDPASLGNFALLIGQSEEAYLDAAKNQLNHFSDVPRWPNGAISQRDNTAELWADFMYMAPPFMAYAGPAFNDGGSLQSAIEQCGLYREVLSSNSNSGDVSSGAWHHIIGPETQDTGLWSTGNGWAAMGMARVLATLLHWHPTETGPDFSQTRKDLFEWIGEILRGAMSSPKDDGLLRNYLNDDSWFGETSGTALLTATVYRTVVTAEMMDWAKANMRAVAAHVDDNGLASPAVNPLGWGDRTPYTQGSPEGQSFLVLLYSAWRDCIEAGICSENL
ncbi:uncharacterized protein RCC_02176 [Ramularia collo-cygni]|uniref:Glycosyl hydrolase family 88 n=1 Tax=Ramularia collo-cygni TaxID=112498 RepID=A0A2D3V1J4_9PEZI|nr:uncharacterized protein RCC_02176 [Ramularia collo-cygni]CZT16334.1 uncharacterized protein RCC_02176 [Ramularia collo-cygni]